MHLGLISSNIVSVTRTVLSEKQFGPDGKEYRQTELYDMVAKYGGQPDIFGTYTDIPMLKVNQRYQEGDPAAVYSYTADSIIEMRGETHWGYGDRPYLIMFRAPLDNAGVLNFDESGNNGIRRAIAALETMGQTKEWLKATIIPYEQEYLSASGISIEEYLGLRATTLTEDGPAQGSDHAFIWAIIRSSDSDDKRAQTIKSSKLVRAMNIWAAIDMAGESMGEPNQGAFFDITRLKVLDVVRQRRNYETVPSLAKDDHHEDERANHGREKNVRDGSWYAMMGRNMMRSGSQAKSFIKYLPITNPTALKKQARIVIATRQKYGTEWLSSASCKTIKKGILRLMGEAPPESQNELQKIVTACD